MDEQRYRVIERIYWGKTPAAPSVVIEGDAHSYRLAAALARIAKLTSPRDVWLQLV